MVTKIDDISVGDFVVITKDTLYPEVEYGDGFVPRYVQPLQYSGEPVEVIAIGLPFLVIKRLRSESEHDTLDIRRYHVQRVSTDYVKQFLPKNYTNKTGIVIEKDEPEKRSKICPECGGSLVETRFSDIFDTSSKDFYVWAFKCKSCTFVGAKRKT